jgi:hypothetical protein
MSLSSCANAKTNAMFSEPNPVVQVVLVCTGKAVFRSKVEAKVAYKKQSKPLFNDDLSLFLSSLNRNVPIARW